MAENNVEWGVVFHDDATLVLQKVKRAQDDLADSVKKAASETEKSGSTWKETAKGVFAGAAVYDLAKKAVGTFTDFLKGSVEASMEAEATMAQVRNNVKNAGFTYDEVKEKLEAYSASTIQLGFDDEDTAESVSKLMLVTKDYEKALKLNQLAMDLARNKSIDLSTATGLITQVTAGNNRVLKQYGIELRDGATAAEALGEIQDRVKGSTEAFAETTQGKLTIARQQWGNMKEAIGDQLAPVFAEFMDKVNEHMPEITSLVASFGSAVASVANVVIDLADAWAVWTNTATTKIDKTLERNLDEVAKRFNENQAKLKHSINLTGKEIANMPIEQQRELFKKFGKGAVEAAEAAESAGKKIQYSFAGIGSSSGAADSMNKVKDAISSLKDKYAENQEKIGESLSKLEEDHTTTVKNITDKITDLRGQLKAAEDDYKRMVGEMNKSEAEKVVDQEKKITDLKKQLAEEKASAAEGGIDAKEATRIKEIEDELIKEQAAYDSYSSRIKEIDADVTEARRRANETEFERFIEDLKIKRSETEADFAKKKEQINAEIVEQESILERENIVYEGKRAQYKLTDDAFKAFHDRYLDNMDSMKKATEKSVNDMNAKLKILEDTLKKIESAKNKAGLLSAAGYDTSSASAAASSSPSVTQPTSNTITINLGGVTVQNQAQIDDLVAKIKRELELAGLASQK